ncbi:recombinase family protein [Hymenobacter persicinus]|uniref:Resolvase n=1 Tax=Hymenobacter persicinus TaxID=2025506 RepID=A0A4Q5LD48_9BACT|nr:recombinase family protein [Hymenobacter persicinus]RYU81265.1 resolvase [Hymenobacter persicinus]
MLDHRNQFITYYRVSTQKQGTSGLGLEAQKAAVNSFVKDSAHILGEFVEIESGKKDHRPQLHAAIAAAQSQNATLLIAKLDRLSRNAGFIFALRDAGVTFLCCDMPDANSLTVGLFAVIAQHERETISKRTKDALAAKKARGCTLGSPQNLTAAARTKGEATRRRNAQENTQNKQASKLSVLLHAQGHSLQQIVVELNDAGFKTRRGKLFYHSAVQRLLRRGKVEPAVT